MNLTAIETIALILIVISAIKLVVLLINPKGWVYFAKGVYSKPKVVQVVAFILASVVLYYLIQGGIDIVQIVATTVFIMLFMAIGMAPEVVNLMKDFENKIKKGIWKQYRFYLLIWAILIVWAAKEIFS